MTHVTLQDVARLAGVSTKTVSRVINNESNVAAETLEQVEKAISSLNYVPNTAARNLSRGRAGAIGLVAGRSVSSLFSSTLLADMLQDTSQRGYNLVLFPTGPNVTERVTRALRARQMDGAVLYSRAACDDDLIHQLDSLNKPYVVIHPESWGPHNRASFVRIDDCGGAKQATAHLIGLGHREIGVISHPRHFPADERIKGYCQALREAGIPFRSELLIGSDGPAIEVGYRGAAQLIPRHPEITAVFASTDEIAIGALSAIWQMGLKVPEDISVVGFDDIALASTITPPLTTIHQPIDQISRSAVDLIVDMIEHPSRGGMDLLLPTTLIVRKSCQPPRREG